MYTQLKNDFQLSLAMISVAVRIGPLMKDIFFVKPYILYFTTNKHTNEQEHAKGGKCIVFTQTKREADKLSYGMERSFKCQALHGDISQSQRERTLMDFREGRINILIATDVAARGLDIPNVDLVCFLFMFGFWRSQEQLIQIFHFLFNVIYCVHFVVSCGYFFVPTMMMVSDSQS